MDRDRPGRMTVFRKDLTLAFGAVIFSIVGSVLYLYVGAGDEVQYTQVLLAILLVALAMLIWTAVFVRNN